MADRLRQSTADWLRTSSEAERAVFVESLTPEQRHDLRWHWALWARPGQIAPAGDWSVWLICAGRGFGKTRAGSEWVRQIATEDSGARIALIGASFAEVRAIMVEGESGLMTCSPPHRRPEYEPSLKRLTWPNGAQAFLYSAAEPESLRGPQHSHAWCDEVAKWDREKALRCWDNLQLGMRVGETPQIVATTTPRATPLMRRLLKDEKAGGVVVSRGTTYDNRANLPARFITDIDGNFAGTTMGRQELGGEMLEDIEGALWTRSLLENCREQASPKQMTRIVVGVDPPVSAHGDACGIIVAGLSEGGIAAILADCSVERASPERWARAVAEASAAWSADRIVAEANQGGAMVASVLRAAEISLPVKLVHASRGKVARAEPVAALYEAGRVRHSAMFVKLEDELCGLMAGGAYEGPGRSPDRADALVWALTELMLGKRANPRILGL